MSQTHPLSTSQNTHPYSNLEPASQLQRGNQSPSIGNYDANYSGQSGYAEPQQVSPSQPTHPIEGLQSNNHEYLEHTAHSQTQLNPTQSRRSHRSHHIMEETEEELTEDEKIEYEKGLITWEKAKNWRFWFRKEWFWWYIAFILIVVVVALMAFFHHSIIDWLTPFVRRIRELKAGFVIPAAILFVLSFPPLFGNETSLQKAGLLTWTSCANHQFIIEIVIILVGIVYGLGKGFAIVVIGVGLGETTLFLLFKYCCRARAERMTRKSLNYACLSESIREGGFIMAWVVRLSVIPTHYTTAILAICGLPTWKFVLALLLSTPKQLIAVYVGVVLGQTNASTNSHVISDCVFAACAIITLGALYFIYKRMIKVRKSVLISMREDLHKRHVEVPAPPED